MRVGSVPLAASAACSVIVAGASVRLATGVELQFMSGLCLGIVCPRSHAVSMKRQLRGPNLGVVNVVWAETRLQVAGLAV